MAVDLDGLTFTQERVMTPNLARTLQAIYETSFPPSQREPFSDVLSDVVAGVRDLTVAWLDGEAVGLVVALDLSALEACYLEYMAVTPELRSRGIGGRLLEHIVARLKGEGCAEGVIFEVESVQHGPTAEAGMRQRRMDFYRRHGARVVECAPDYRGPNLAGPGEVHFTIMWIPLAGEGAAPSGERLRTLIRAMLTEGYGLTDDHPLVQAVLGSLVC